MLARTPGGTRRTGSVAKRRAAIVLTFDVAGYSAAISELLRDKRTSALGPGSPNKSMRRKLESLSLGSAFRPHAVRNRDMASACLAGLWLYHDFLDESHALSQEISTTTGSYWHGILHRREPDYPNAKYWFRRVGDHPVFEPLHLAAGEMAAAQKLPSSAKFLATQSKWEPFAFVDLCESSLAGHSPCEMLCQQVQMREWEILFEYCYRQALGLNL